MTIDERVDEVVKFRHAGFVNDTEFKAVVRGAMREVAHDQRHAYADALLTVSNIGSRSEIDTAIDAGAAHVAVMNTPLP